MNVYENILKNTSIIMFIVNPDGIVIDTNGYTTKLFDDNDVVGKYFYSLIDSSGQASIRAASIEKKESSFEATLKLGFDKFQPVYFNVNVISEYMFIIGFVKHAYNLKTIEPMVTAYGDTERTKVISRENKRQWQIMNIDPVTGLYNKEFFKYIFEVLHQKAVSMSSGVGIISFDIEKFDDIIDNFGPDKGKSIQAGLAQLILTSIRSTDYAIKYDDKFIVLIPNTNAEVLKKISQRIVDGASKNLSISLNSGYACTIDNSIGNGKDAMNFIYEKIKGTGSGNGNNLIDSV